jgi:hypothetical protein
MRWFLVGLAVAGCGGVEADKQDAAVVRDAAIDSPGTDAQVLPVSCKALHAAQPNMPSGMYMIDPDGAGADAPLSVTCDMAVEGGGWTIVFFPPTPNSVVPIAYTSSTPRLLQDATQVLLAFRSATQVAYTNYATLDLPAEWRTDTPFNYPANDLTTGVSINGGALVTTMVRFGKANFSAQCADGWNTAAADHGRICIQNTVAPFFSGFATAVNTDSCSKSNEAYNASGCANDLRFSIAVR